MTTPARTATVLTLLAVALALATVVATGMGYIEIGPAEVVRSIAAAVSGDGSLVAGLDRVVPLVVVDVRLPRILCAVAVGGGLAVAGVAYQGILLNPLADPYTLGVSGGAAFGAALAFLLGLGSGVVFSVPLFAFAGALAALFVVLYLSTFDGRMQPATLILAGVIVGAILAAGISFLKYLADEQVSVIIFWLMGSFASRTWPQAAMAWAAAIAGTAVIVYYGRDLNILALGNRAAASLGVEAVRLRRVLLVSASLVAAVCVSISGIIGFVGLIVPHLMRFLVGPENRRLALASFLAGGLLLLAADTVSRALLPREVPVGVLTALLGGPYFCYLFRRRGSWHG
ncbi:MAG: iron ABC transporter permease [Thermodesulfobacteriota bacterium]